MGELWKFLAVFELGYSGSRFALVAKGEMEMQSAVVTLLAGITTYAIFYAAYLLFRGVVSLFRHPTPR